MPVYPIAITFTTLKMQHVSPLHSKYLSIIQKIYTSLNLNILAISLAQSTENPILYQLIILHGLHYAEPVHGQITHGDTSR